MVAMAGVAASFLFASDKNGISVTEPIAFGNGSDNDHLFERQLWRFKKRRLFAFNVGFLPLPQINATAMHVLPVER